jgi:hypothetical protein
MYYRNKYHAKKTEVDGIIFDSKKEAARYCSLKLMERAGEITDLQLQVPYELQPKYRRQTDGKAIRAITYVADFVYTDIRTGEQVIEDAKGMETDVFKIKKKLFEYQNPGKEIREV